MNTLTFLAPSGSPANLTVIEQLDPGSTSGANHVGFFGAGGPEGIPFAVIVDRYQDKTFITNSTGQNLGSAPYGVTGSGELVNHKYLTSNTANVSGLGSVSLVNVTPESGTLLLRFEPSGAVAVRTQNTILYTVVLNATSGIDDVSSVVTSLKVQSYEPGADGTWTQTAGTGAVDNRLLLLDHDVPDTVHDFFVGLSASPEAVGQRNDFGFFMVIEFL
jgi:hypothetical protein